MCGIVAAVAERPVQSILVEGLKRLEYRGYDSAGVATLANGRIERTRAEGKVAELEALLVDSRANQGIAHTRWATHGVPSVRNAHPHQSGRFAVVHNGIIENFEGLKRELADAGYTFDSDTDTETVAHLLHHLSQTHHTSNGVHGTGSILGSRNLWSAYKRVCSIYSAGNSFSISVGISWH